MTIDEFQKVELKIGRVLSAERVQKSEKLLKIQIDLGVSAADSKEVRQVLSGIAKAYAPEDLIGKSVVLITNLEPREMMGLKSEGMLLAATGTDGKPAILTVLEDVAPGAKIT